MVATGFGAIECVKKKVNTSCCQQNALVAANTFFPSQDKEKIPTYDINTDGQYQNPSFQYQRM